MKMICFKTRRSGLEVEVQLAPVQSVQVLPALTPSYSNSWPHILPVGPSADCTLASVGRRRSGL